MPAKDTPAPRSATGLGGPRLLIIVQAEVDDTGKTIYGVIGSGAGRRAKPEELTNIKPIKKSFSLFDLFK